MELTDKEHQLIKACRNPYRLSRKEWVFTVALLVWVLIIFWGNESWNVGKGPSGLLFLLLIGWASIGRMRQDRALRDLVVKLYKNQQSQK